MEMTIAFYSSIVLLAIILFIGVSKRPQTEATFFDRVTTKELQGFFAFFIIFHHIVINLEDPATQAHEMVNFYYYGILAIAFYFFCSGFGLLKRWMTDKSYLKGFMKKRVFTVLVPYFICNYIYLTTALISNLKYGFHFTFPELIGSFFGFFLINNEMWFAVEIMILYFAFKIIFEKVRKPLTGIILMTAVVAVLMTIGLLSGHSEYTAMSYWFKGEWWYNTILMFPLGMIYAYKEERINRVIRKAFVSLTILTSVLLVIVDYIHRELIAINIFWTEFENPNHIWDKLKGLSVEIVLEILFLLLVLLILSKIRINNRVLKFLGKISLEIVMTNYLVISLLYPVLQKHGILVFIPTVIVGTLICSAILYAIKNIVLERKTNFFDGKVQ